MIVEGGLCRGERVEKIGDFASEHSRVRFEGASFSIPFLPHTFLYTLHFVKPSIFRASIWGSNVQGTQCFRGLGESGILHSLTIGHQALRSIQKRSFGWAVHRTTILKGYIFNKSVKPTHKVQSIIYFDAN